MLMMRRVVLCVGMLVVAAGQAQAQVKPFKISGAGVAVEGLPLPGQPARDHWSIGTATHLGKYYGEGGIETLTAEFLPDGTITGDFHSSRPFDFVGANGDVLSCQYGRPDAGATTVGRFELIPLPEFGLGVYMASFVAEFVPVKERCTGKFAGVTGSWVMYAMTDPFYLGTTFPVGYSWEGKGKLNFAKSR